MSAMFAQQLGGVLLSLILSAQPRRCDDAAKQRTTIHPSAASATAMEQSTPVGLLDDEQVFAKRWSTSEGRR